MWGAVQTIARAVSPRGWAALAIGAAALVLALWLYNAGRRDADADHAARADKAEVQAGQLREKASTERTLDNAAVDRRLEEWNHAAEQIPDAAPDDRERQRRCRQLRDAGYGDLPECRGPAR